MCVAAHLLRGASPRVCRLHVGSDATPGSLLQLGDLVQTPYGVGVIENVRVGPAPVAGDRTRASDTAPGSATVAYHVMFQWGRGILAADAVKVMRRERAATSLDELGAAVGACSCTSAACACACGHARV